MKSDSRPLIVGTEDIAVVEAMCVCVYLSVCETEGDHTSTFLKCRLEEKTERGKNKHQRTFHPGRPT